jgi:hypothetical protein
MVSGQANHLLQQIRTLVAAHSLQNVPDRELLDCFLQHHDEGAFTAIVERHGMMVLAVCRRVLGSAQDAEDACQAALLVLARKAGCMV